MRGVIPALARRLPLPPRREAAPLALLLLALSAVFVFGHDRSQFYRKGHHNISIQTLEIAANLSAGHGFLQFRSRSLDHSGEPGYVLYNRFPIGSAALVRLAILPFGDDAPMAIRSARLLMLAFFAAAAAFAYLALARLLGDRRIALAATLLAFSSFQLLFYSDMVSPEVAGLFGVMLVFHGMVLFEQEGRLRQLLARTAAAVLLDWHVAGLIAAFVLLGLGAELLRRRGYTLAVMESCTGGMVGAAITEISGSSDYFLGGAITYSNAMKAQAGVPDQTLQANGAVSEEAAREMAKAARRTFGADCGVSVTGVAGPDDQNGVKAGTVFIGVAAPSGSTVTRHEFPSRRPLVRNRAVTAALLQLIQALQDPAG